MRRCSGWSALDPSINCILHCVWSVTGLHDIDEYIQSQLLLAVCQPSIIICFHSISTPFRLSTSPHMCCCPAAPLWPRHVARVMHQLIVFIFYVRSSAARTPRFCIPSSACSSRRSPAANRAARATPLSVCLSLYARTLRIITLLVAEAFVVCRGYAPPPGYQPTMTNPLLSHQYGSNLFHL